MTLIYTDAEQGVVKNLRIKTVHVADQSRSGRLEADRSKPSRTEVKVIKRNTL